MRLYCVGVDVEVVLLSKSVCVSMLNKKLEVAFFG